MSLIEVEQVFFSYKDSGTANEAVSGLSLSIDKGSFTAIIGPNGCGKSTLARLFNGLIVPDKGRVLVKGLDTSDPKNIIEIRKTVGLVFQNPDNQIIGDTVEEDVAFGPENLGLKPEIIDQRIEKSLETVGISDLRFRSPHKLSGGQKQRVAIAGALALGSSCLVLDEATSMLDPFGRKEVLKTLHKLNKDRGVTIILITHNMNECVDCDKVIVLKEGHKILDDTPEKVFSEYELLKNMKLGVPVATELAHRFDLEPGIVSETQLIEALKRRKYNA